MLGPERERYNLWEWNTYGNFDRGRLCESFELTFVAFVSIPSGVDMGILSCHLGVGN